MLIDTSIFRGVRLNKFVIRAGKQNRNILYNTATGAIVVINGEEDLNNSLDQLKRMFFYVPEDFDEISWVNDLRKTKIAKEKNNIITGYTIFSTSDCNARCFYCFEKGAQRNDMSPNTALDVANFITKKCNGNKVVLRWFGGEPLLNTKAMDIICETLKNNSIEFTSSMISNGSLFNNSNVTKAKNLWNLKGVQITLDGTKNVYQKAKSYVNSDGKEFDKVIENIEQLIETEIRVSVRLNQDLYNTDDLKELVLFLEQKFADRKYFSVYNSLIYTQNPDESFENDRLEAFKKVQREIIDRNLFRDNYLNKRLKIKHCMADDATSVVILPNGDLGRCEHYVYEHLIGSIYSNEINKEEINKWKDTYQIKQKCYDCPLYPQCLRIKMCPEEPKDCSFIQCENKIELMKEILIKQFGS